MFNWLRNYFARNSTEFKEQAERIEEQDREIEGLRAADLASMIDYEERIKEVTRERDEANADLEVTRSELEHAGMRLDRLRRTKHELERETSELKSKIALSIPINAVGNMLKSSQYAGLFVNSDDMVIFSNSHANSYFGKSLEGKSMMEVLPPRSMDLLKERLERERIGFKFNEKSPIYGWHVAVARDHDGFYGYTLSNQRGFVQKLRELFLAARESKEYAQSEGGILVPDTKPIVP